MTRPTFQIDASNTEVHTLIVDALRVELADHADYSRIDARLTPENGMLFSSMVWNTPVLGQSATIRAYHPEEHIRKGLMKLIQVLLADLYVDVEAWEGMCRRLGAGYVLALPAASLANGSIALPPAR